MTKRYNEPLYQIAAIGFAIALPVMALLAFLGPPVLGLDAIPGWMTATLLTLALVCIVTGPLAWRWFYLRQKD